MAAFLIVVMRLTIICLEYTIQHFVRSIERKGIEMLRKVAAAALGFLVFIYVVKNPEEAGNGVGETLSALWTFATSIG